MKIQDNQASAVGGAKRATEAQLASSTAARRGPGGLESTSDQVQLSALAEQIRAEDAASPERVARVEQLALRVKEGSYEPDASVVADMIIGESQKSPHGPEGL